MPIKINSVKTKTAPSKAKNAVQQFTDWSYSRYADYSRCPFYAKEKHINKIVEPGNAAMARGTEIHAKAEQYISGKLRKIPKELTLAEESLKQMRKDKALVELRTALTRDWKQAPFFGEKNVCRVIIDTVAVKSTTAKVIDWKTGASKNTPPEVGEQQLSLQALAVFSIWPLVARVTAWLEYVDEGNYYEAEFLKKDAPALQKDWDKKIKSMLNDTQFKPKPNSKCRWCPYAKGNGGNCKY